MLLAMPVVASAGISGGLVGDCADCHTMHNSELGAAVAVTGLTDSITNTPIQNLLRMDCVACHAADPAGGSKIVEATGGSLIPQVMHADGTGDLAGGNFANINTSNRKGHNVADLFPGGDTSNKGTYNAPPGKYRNSTHGPSGVFGTGGFDKFSCAGSGGCHGTRNQILSSTKNANTTSGVNGNVSGEAGPDFYTNIVRRTGLPAITGSHHNNFDGKKDAIQNVKGAHSGTQVAQGYRFIPGLKGYGNEVDRWQNASPTSHNEYKGNNAATNISSCSHCHVNATVEQASHVGSDSVLIVPNQSMSGFCVTCHGVFHSVGAVSNAANGNSGAFLRHPSDYVIPSTGEYAGYTSYNLSAPVARPTLSDTPSDVVTPGTDMVMCLSCHVAHASQYDGMLRYDYELQTAGAAGAADGTGCLACHTTKGVLKTS